jgi:hypothetical protein
MSDYDIDTIALMSLEIFYRALDFQRALMFIQDSASQKNVGPFRIWSHMHRRTLCGSGHGGTAHE